jgi:amino acid adenylation domain-containing protein
VLRRSTGFAVQFRFSDDTFDRYTASNFVDSFEYLLMSCTAKHRNVSLVDVPLVGKTQQRFLVEELNQTHRDYDPTVALHQHFEQRVEMHPDDVAVIFEDQSITYRDLDRRANQLARQLQELGVGPESRVGVSVDRSIDMVVSLYGVLKAGAAYVPMDPKYPADRLALMLEDSRAEVLITEEVYTDRFPETRTICIDRDWEAISQLSDENPNVELTPKNLAYIIYTSGSTGRPKGVMVEHSNASNFLASMKERLERPERGVWLAATSICFDISVLEIFGTLGAGFQLIIREAGFNNDGGEFSIPALIKRRRVTHFQCTPSQASMVLADPEGRASLSRLSQMLLGGEPMPMNLAKDLTELIPNGVSNLYGPTEVTVYSTGMYLGEIDGPVSTGKPVSNTQCYILDEKLRPVPPGVVGELVLGGDSVVRGYNDREELTAACFVHDPFSTNPGARMYRSGDLARWKSDGNLDFLGRNDFQVKIRGFRIELGEIETAIQEFSDVSQVVVVVHEAGENDKRLVAFYSTETGKPLDHQAVRQRLGQSLTEYMVPAIYQHLPQLPHTPNGKIDRKQLPAPDVSTVESNADYAPPRNDVETRLAASWKRLLNVERVGIDDDFFQLGGHSVLTVQLCAAIRKDFGQETTPGTIFANPTIRQLADKIEAGTGDEALTIALRSTGNKAPVFLISGIHLYQDLADRLDAGHPVYGIYLPEEEAMFQGENGESALSVERLAEQYVEQLQKERPHGPYVIGGVCFGGLVAYEMARLLTATGHKVEQTILMETVLPQASRRRIGKLIRDLVWSPLFLGKRSIASRIVRKVWRGRDASSRDAGPESFSPEEQAQREEARVRELRDRIQNNAMEDYAARIKPYSGNVIAIRALDEPVGEGYEIEQSGGFAELAPTETHFVRGTHLGILADPNVDALARILSHKLKGE